jgi:Transposase IS200 like
MRGRLWSPSYFAGSCGGAPLSIVKDYIADQKRPDQARLPPSPERQGYRARSPMIRQVEQVAYSYRRPVRERRVPEESLDHSPQVVLPRHTSCPTGTAGWRGVDCAGLTVRRQASYLPTCAHGAWLPTCRRGWVGQRRRPFVKQGLCLVSGNDAGRPIAADAWSGNGGARSGPPWWPRSPSRGSARTSASWCAPAFTLAVMAGVGTGLPEMSCRQRERAAPASASGISSGRRVRVRS